MTLFTKLRLDHALHFPDLALSDYCVFISLKMHTGEKKICNSRGGEVDKWTKEVVPEFYEAGIKKLILRHLTTCVERNGDYMDK